MSDPTCPIDLCVEAARRRDAPPPGAAPRTWALLVPTLGPGGALPGVVGVWAGARTAMAITLVVAAGALTRALAPPSPRHAPTPPPAAVVSARDMSEKTSSEPAAPAADDAPAPAGLVPRLAAPGTTAPDRLAVEIALLDRARAHLRARDAAAALALLADHARDFPRSSLGDAREAARVEALCLRGDRDAAAAVARQLLAARPDSALARRFEGFVCAP
jgi:hypothetical protein